MTKFTISDLKAIKYVDNNPEIITTVISDNLEYQLELNKDYKLTVNVSSNMEFHSIGMDITWDDPNLIIMKETNGNPVKENGSLFDGVPNTFVANLFPDENRVYVAKMIDNFTASSNSIGDSSILSIFIRLEQGIDNIIRVYLTIEAVV